MNNVIKIISIILIITKTLTMSSIIKNFLNMVMCTNMIIVTYFYPTDLDMMSLSAYPLFLYCILDLVGNSWDMVIHHISTLMTGLAIYCYRYESQDVATTALVVNSLILTEISTIFLDLIHLGYRHVFIKLGFLFTFTYFRTIGLPWLLIFDSNTCYFCMNATNYVCDSNMLCHLMWSLGISNIMLLNTMWFYKLIMKTLN